VERLQVDCVDEVNNGVVGSYPLKTFKNVVTDLKVVRMSAWGRTNTSSTR